MANPTLNKKNEETFTPTEDTKKLFQVIYRDQHQDKKDSDSTPKIKVSEIVSKMAFYYEKIRNTVDYKEENLLRKNAIERILKRQVVIEGAMTLKELNSEEIIKELLVELIRAGYLKNNTIPETKVDELALTFNKYLLLRELSLKYHKHLNLKEKNELTRWIIAIAASEIEEKLGRSQTDLMVIGYMHKILINNVELPEDSDYEDERDIQIYIGIHRSYSKFDNDMLGSILFKYFNADWNDPKKGVIDKISRNILVIREAIENQISHPLSGQLNRVISRYTVFFSVLKEVIEEDPEGCFDSFKNDPKAFPRQIKKICNRKYAISRKKLWRAAIRSIVYIFITKSVFAAALEIPATAWLGEELNSFSLLANIIFPPALLFLIVLFTRVPGDDNTSKIVEGIEEIVYTEKERKAPFRLRKPGKRSGMMNAIFGVIYTITFFVSFGVVVWALDKMNFSWVSIIIFLFFLALISFFSSRIRRSAREMFIIEPKENILSLLSDFFYIPIVAAGKWLSENFSRVNVFVFILDFIIEAPFKIFVKIAEEWTKYVKERKDEIV